VCEAKKSFSIGINEKKIIFLFTDKRKWQIIAVVVVV
jgi:hypothetical protein